MKNLIVKMLSCPQAMPLLMAAIAVASLGMAFIAQYGFGLAPCILCIIQRYPYGIIIAFGMAGFLMSCKYKKAVAGVMGLIGVTFLTNAVIAFYHTGVERHWWPSHLEGCAIPNLGTDPNNIIKMLEQSQAVRCDEIPWADPIFNLSMANYNVIFCLGLGIIALISARLICKKES